MEGNREHRSAQRLKQYSGRYKTGIKAKEIYQNYLHAAATLHSGGI